MFRLLSNQPVLVHWVVIAASWLLMQHAASAAPSVTDALKLKPVQQDVPYDTPSANEAKNCTIKAEKINGSTAWVIRQADGSVLRKFSDSDDDNVVDTWSYYRDGLEIYRDVDANYNGKADQYRWFHGAGMRWGIDRNEDGKIDSWKLISAEEVAEEVAAAVRTKDLDRFARLLLKGDEIKKLGLGKSMASQLSDRAKKAPREFREFVATNDLGKKLEFSDFGGLKPGMVPAGTRGSGKDLLVYENVWAMVRSEETLEQLQLGTMVNIKGAWKLVDAPTAGESTRVAGSIFFVPGSGGGGGVASRASVANEPTAKMQEILADLEKLDQKLVRADATEKAKLNVSRANMLLQLANASPNSAERSQWLRQLADMVSAATQDGSFPRGLEYLKKLESQLQKEGQADELLAYFEFQRMVAKHYGVTLAAKNVDYAEAHAQWLEDLEAFVQAHPDDDNSAEALWQLAMGSEISGENQQAVKWYTRVARDHPSSIHAPTARGAVVRLSSKGRRVRLQGNAVNGGKFDLSRLEGRAVVIQYWTSSNDVCRANHAVLSDLYKKYGGNRGLEIVGVSLDYSRDEVMSYLKENRLPWPQLYEAGGFDSRYAKEMGVVTVPLMMLVGADGKVINDNIQAAEIEEAIKKMRTRQASRR